MKLRCAIESSDVIEYLCFFVCAILGIIGNIHRSDRRAILNARNGCCAMQRAVAVMIGSTSVRRWSQKSMREMRKAGVLGCTVVLAYRMYLDYLFECSHGGFWLLLRFLDYWWCI